MAKAMSETTIHRDSYAAWCHANDKTLINGAKIYTGSITADKINVNSLEAICAKIGGFTISEYGLTAGFDTSDAGVEITPAYIKLGSKFYAFSDGELSVEEANAKNLNVQDMMRFMAPSENLAVGGGTVYETVGNISVSDKNNGYRWGDGVTVTGRCVEHNVMSRFNDAVSMGNIYVDNNVLIGGKLTLGSLESVDISFTAGSGTITENKSKYFPALKMVVIDLRIRLASVPYAADTHHSLLTIASAYKPAQLKALSAIQMINNSRVYQAAMQTTGEVLLKLSTAITASSYVSVQGCYFL